MSTSFVMNYWWVLKQDSRNETLDSLKSALTVNSFVINIKMRFFCNLN